MSIKLTKFIENPARAHWNILARDVESAAILEKVWEEENLSALQCEHWKDANGGLLFGTPQVRNATTEENIHAQQVSDLSEIPEDVTVLIPEGVEFFYGTMFRHGELVIVKLALGLTDPEGAVPESRLADAVHLTLKLLRQERIPIHHPHGGVPFRLRNGLYFWMACAADVTLGDLTQALNALGAGIFERVDQIVNAGVAEPEDTSGGLEEGFPPSTSASARSNYFRVKDEAGFRRWAASRHLDVWEDDDTKGLFAIVPQALSGSWTSVSDVGFWPAAVLTETGVERVNIVGELSAHLSEDSVAILQELRFLHGQSASGHAVAINSKGESVEVSTDEIYEIARQLGGDVIAIS